MTEEFVCYSYRDQRQNTDTEPNNKCFWRVTRFVFTMILLVLILGASLAGSIETYYILEWLPLEKLHLENWLSEIIQRILVAIPLGFVIGLISFNLRAGIALCILTVCSLHVPWQPYIPFQLNYNGTGVFDFVLGKSPNAFPTLEFREIAGVSLWGLVLTYPAGYILYALGFGSTYSLCGGFVGLIYSLSKFFYIGLSAFYLWGFIIWCVLLISSVNHLCNATRYVISKTKQPPLQRCYQWVCYGKLYIGLFEVITFLFAIFLLSCLFYIGLTDVTREEKGPILVGLLGNTLALIITQSYRTGKCVMSWQRKRSVRQEGRVTINRPAAGQTLRTLPTGPASATRPPPTYNQVLRAEPHIYPEIETGAEENDRPNSRQLNNRILEDDDNVEAFPNERTTLFREREPAERKRLLHGCYMCIFFFQRFFYTDILRLIQLLLDVTGGLALLVVLTLTVFARVKNWDNPRFGVL